VSAIFEKRVFSQLKGVVTVCRETVEELILGKTRSGLNAFRKFDGRHNMVNLKKLTALLVVVALVITAAACAPAPAEKEVIKIGHLGLLSGAGAVA